jgi:hypothetical protein
LDVHPVDALATRFGLGEEERRILSSSPAQLDRRLRRRYHRDIEPRLPEFRTFLQSQVQRERLALGSEADHRWATAAAFRIMRHGFVSVADQLVMDVVGRRLVSDVIRAVKARAPTTGPELPG